MLNLNNKYWIVLLFFISWMSSFPAFSTPKAAVAMPDAYSAEVAQAILQQGGHAVDAAVAAGFVLAVTYPEAGNLGGGGFMTLWHQGQARFLDYRETAPKSAHPKLYLDDKGEVIPFQSLIGYRASGVPGTVMGLWQAHQAHGRFDWEKLLQPAIDLAQQGFVVPEQMVNTANWFQGWIADKSTQPLNFAHYFGGLKKGETLRQPKLAQALSLIAKQGPRAFYQGPIAQAMVKQMQANQGLITLEDLAGYQAKWRQPIQIEWRGKQVISAPPPSSGGIAIAQFLQLYELTQTEFNTLTKELTSEEVKALRVHRLAEIAKRVYADRAAYLGDSDFVKVPIERLISADYLSKRVKGLDLQAISQTEQVQPGLAESPETTHFSIVDFEGNAVSNTYTLNMPFGSGVVIEEYGFLMNDEMDDFATKPGVANAFGVLGGKANQIEPGKRMLSSMSPTLVVKDQRVDMVVGTPGGSSIITSVVQTLLNHYELGLEAQQAVDAARFHHQLWPKDQIDYHPDLSDEMADSLQLMGYRLKRNNYLGDVQLIVRQPEGWQAASDARWRGESRVFGQ